VTQEGSLFQGGSGKDSIYTFTGSVSGGTVQGLDGNDLISLGNETETIDLTAKVSGGTSSFNASSGALSAGEVVVNYSGNYISAGVITNGTIATSTALTADGGPATLTITELVSTGIQSLLYSTVNGNAGNDTITLGDQLSSVAGSLVAGGAGNDIVGSYNWASGANTTGVDTGGQIQDAFSGNTINGGAGNDTVFVNYTGGGVATLSARANTLNGNAGNDSVVFSSTSAAFFTGLIGGGAGDDTVYATFRSGGGWSINGGAGNDSVVFDGLGGGSTGLIQGDTTNTQSGADTIQVTFSGASSMTVQGLAGHDSIYISASTGGGTNFIAGNGGNDTITWSTAGTQAGNLSAWTVNGGAGNDSIVLTAQSAGAIASSVFNLGAGDDTITVGASSVAGSAGSDGATINGGAGKDLITMSAVGSASGRAVFGYAAFSESTIDSMDTITFATAAASSTTNSGYADSRLRFSFNNMGTIALASGAGSNADGGGMSASAGYIVFSSFSDTDLTARVSAIDASYTTTGNVAIFTTDGAAKFMFVQGGSTDTVIKLASANGLSAGNNGASLYITGGTALGL